MAFKGNRFALLEDIDDEVEVEVEADPIQPFSRKKLFDHGYWTERLKRIDATQLPEEIIQHIQSFMSGKEAARTSILSISWYAAWLTRPNLDLVESDILNPLFKFRPWFAKFIKLAKKTLQRYKERDLKIQSFRLKMDGKSNQTFALADELIQKAVKLGANDVDIEFAWQDYDDSFFLLPREVFESEFLVNLSLKWCTINVQYPMVRFSRLKSLNLVDVHVESNNFWDIISMCPLIERLVISGCSRLDLEPAGLSVYDYHKLRVLSLEGVSIDNWFFPYISRFPCLKELTVRHCYQFDEIQLCSNSLEFVNFDVDFIKEFKLSSPCVPSLSFQTYSTEWESDISIQCTLEIPCLIEVRKFLQELCSSKINLKLQINCVVDEYWDNATGDIISSAEAAAAPPAPIVVEKLTLHVIAHSSCLIHSRVLEDLFRSCRPNLIVLYLEPFSDPACTSNNDFTRLVYDAVIEDRNMGALHDVEEANVEYFEDDDLAGCRSLPCKTLLDASTYSVNRKIRVCLQLKWRES